MLTITMNAKQITSIYNNGYNAGYNDTVEGCYTDVLPQDMDTYNIDIVTEIMVDLLRDSLRTED